MPGTGPLYYAEFFDLSSRDDARALYERRAREHLELVLVLVADRIGKLGPNPRGVAFWQLPGYDAIEPVAVELDGVETPVELVRAGLYADIGREIL